MDARGGLRRRRRGEAFYLSGAVRRSEINCLVAPAGAADGTRAFEPNPRLLDGAAETNDVDEGGRKVSQWRCRVARRAARALFGAGARDADVVDFSQGLRRARRRLVDDFGRRGARVVSVQQNEDKQDQFLSTGTWLGLGIWTRLEVMSKRRARPRAARPARRGAVADAAAAPRLSASTRTCLAHLGEVLGAARRRDVAAPRECDCMARARVCRERSSPEAAAPNNALHKNLGPGALGAAAAVGLRLERRRDASYREARARAAFEQPPLQAEASGQLGSGRWETLEDGAPRAGRLTFTLSELELRATRRRAGVEWRGRARGQPPPMEVARFWDLDAPMQVQAGWRPYYLRGLLGAGGFVS